jgi:release factor glutamine methyltransferase
MSRSASTAENSSDQTWTVGRLLSWTTEFLRRRGSESPRLDAEVMLAHVLEWQRVQLYTHFDEVIGEQPRERFRQLVRRRSEGSPVAYLVGRKEFYSLSLEVSPAVLIPRPETEFLVVEFLELFGAKANPRAVDVGTGSGCLAIACAHQHRSARFHATDASSQALAIARRNAERHQVADRIVFRRGDLLEPVASEEPFDAILSNPPYIPTDSIGTLEPGVRDYEPHLALDGGRDGLDLVKRLIAQAPSLLRPGGYLLLEIGTAQEVPVGSLINATPELRLVRVIRDLRQHPRVVCAVKEPADASSR